VGGERARGARVIAGVEGPLRRCGSFSGTGPATDSHTIRPGVAPSTAASIASTQGQAFMVDPDAPRRQQAYVAQLTKLLEAGRRGDAMALFMRSIGLPEAMIAGMRQAPMWPGMEALAPTLAYDAAIMGDSLVPAGLVASITAPTLVLTGSDTGAWAASAAQALSAALANPERRTLHGQNHNLAWEVLAPELKQFLTR
jgi:pimeloyl-ACP methyl ester carboxylesterase